MKNISVKLVVLAITLTLITTALVSGTLAKYTRGVSAADSVRVAKFAFNLKQGATQLATQASDTMTLDLFTLNDTGLNDNGGTGNERIIAPGTTKSFTLTVENLSEVDVALSFVLNEVNPGQVPIYYTFNGQRYSSKLSGPYTGDNNGTYGNLAALAAAMGVTLQATDGSTATSGDYTLSWTWAFNTAGTGQTDATDTTLGTAATPANVQLTVAATVTQIDQ